MSEAQYMKQEEKSEEGLSKKNLIEKFLKKSLVGQESAISLVAATIRRKENGWLDENHPIVFMFLGSSGTGKTELAKQVARYIHKNNERAFIRFDMSEFQEKHTISRFIGSPPGYVGCKEGGQLTGALRLCHNAVVLFDEIEKAHPQMLTVLLQLFDEGRLTDGKGYTVECKDAIFIMTSNLASEAIAAHAMQLRAEKQKLKEDKSNGLKHDNDCNETIMVSRRFKDTIVTPILKSHFRRDEFLGRINQMVYFLPFSKAELRQLIKKELESWAAKAKLKFEIEMTWDEEVIDVILTENWNVKYGARSIKQEIEGRIINQISEHDDIKTAEKVHVSVQNSPDNANSSNFKIEIS